MSEDESSESSDNDTIENETWVGWFCSLSGNQLYCEVDRAYIVDSFNLFGIKQYIGKDYNKALETILDRARKFSIFDPYNSYLDLKTVYFVIISFIIL